MLPVDRGVNRVRTGKYRATYDKFSWYISPGLLAVRGESLDSVHRGRSQNEEALRWENA